MEDDKSQPVLCDPLQGTVRTGRPAVSHARSKRPELELRNPAGESGGNSGGALRSTYWYSVASNEREATRLNTWTCLLTLSWRTMRPMRCSISAALHAGSMFSTVVINRGAFNPAPPFLAEMISTGSSRHGTHR